MRCLVFSWLPCTTAADPVASMATAVIPPAAASNVIAIDTKPVCNKNGSGKTNSKKTITIAAATSKTAGAGRGWSWLDVTAESSLQCPMTQLSLHGTDAMLLIEKCPFHKHGERTVEARQPIATTDTDSANKEQCTANTSRNCPFVNQSITALELQLKNGSPHPTADTARLLREVGGGDVIRMYCTRFYSRVFLDKQLDPFFFSSDGAVGHANRLGDWIVELMGGEGTPWFDSGRWGSREAQHIEGWWNNKRAKELQGVPFKLDDCRCWMRLHFWAVRDCGLHQQQHQEFWNWYIQFIAHFIRIYEPTAPPYAAADAEWSASAENIDCYHQQGNHMLDIVGVGRY